MNRVTTTDNTVNIDNLGELNLSAGQSLKNDPAVILGQLKSVEQQSVRSALEETVREAIAELAPSMRSVDPARCSALLETLEIDPVHFARNPDLAAELSRRLFSYLSSNSSEFRYSPEDWEVRESRREVLIRAVRIAGHILEAANIRLNGEARDGGADFLPPAERMADLRVQFLSQHLIDAADQEIRRELLKSVLRAGNDLFDETLNGMALDLLELKNYDYQLEGALYAIESGYNAAGSRCRTLCRTALRLVIGTGKLAESPPPGQNSDKFLKAQTLLGGTQAVMDGLEIPAEPVGQSEIEAALSYYQRKQCRNAAALKETLRRWELASERLGGDSGFFNQINQQLAAEQKAFEELVITEFSS